MYELQQLVEDGQWLVSWAPDSDEIVAPMMAGTLIECFDWIAARHKSPKRQPKLQVVKGSGEGGGE